MAKENPYGTSALGQEGSGLAQVFQPYDASKYEQMLITQKQKEEADKQKTLKDLKLQNVPIPDTKEYWTKLGTGKYYQQWYDIMQDATKRAGELFYKANLDVSDNKGESYNKYYQASQVAKILKEQYNEDATKSLYVRGIYNSERKEFAGNEKNYNIDKTKANFDEFDAYVADLQSRKIDANSKLDLGQKSADFYANVLGGSFLEAKFDYNTFKTNIQSRLKMEQEGTGGVYLSKIGGYSGVGKTTSKTSNVKEATESVINAVTANTQALKYYRENTEYEDGLLNYFNEGKDDKITAEQLALQPLRGNYDKTVEKYFRNNKEAQQQLYKEYQIGDEKTSSFTAIPDRSGGVGRLKTDDNGHPVTYNISNLNRYIIPHNSPNLILKGAKQYASLRSQNPEKFETKIYGAIVIDKNHWQQGSIPVPKNALYVEEDSRNKHKVWNSQTLNKNMSSGTLKMDGEGSAYGAVYADWDGGDISKTIKLDDNVTVTINKYEPLSEFLQEALNGNNKGIKVEKGILTTVRVLGTKENKNVTLSMTVPLELNTWLSEEQTQVLQEQKDNILNQINIGVNNNFDATNMPN